MGIHCQISIKRNLQIQTFHHLPLQLLPTQGCLKIRLMQIRDNIASTNNDILFTCISKSTQLLLKISLFERKIWVIYTYSCFTSDPGKIFVQYVLTISFNICSILPKYSHSIIYSLSQTHCIYKMLMLFRAMWPILCGIFWGIQAP